MACCEQSSAGIAQILLSQAFSTFVSENSEVKVRMAEERRPGDGFGHRFGFAAFKKMRRLNNTVQVEESLPPQVSFVSFKLVMGRLFQIRWS